MSAADSTESRVCKFCVMDSSVPNIKFDEKGQCNCCRDALTRLSDEWYPGLDGAEKMTLMVDLLKTQGKGKPYDVMIGLSGGIDSAYLAHLAVRELGLRVLAVHVDGGWNSEPAVYNIEILVRKLNIDLYTYVVEWEEMRDLQLAFLKASVLNQDIPQDHAFFSALYRTASKFKLNHFLSGVNFASESINPPGWGYPYIDAKHTRAIHKQFGSISLKSFPLMSLPEFLWRIHVRKQITVHKPLNFINYNKAKAQQELISLYGWRDYGGKHCESRFTNFYQAIYLTRKFSFDKRRIHLSSLIVSGQLTREESIAELSNPISEPNQVSRIIQFVAKKLNITNSELHELIDSDSVDHRAYPNQLVLYNLLMSLRRHFRRLLDRTSGGL